MPYLTGVGSYVLADPDNSEDNIASAVYSEEHGDVTEVWTIPVEGGEPGKLIVTNYLINETIRGTFYFDVYNHNTESIKSLKNGSFNLKVIPL